MERFWRKAQAPSRSSEGLRGPGTASDPRGSSLYPVSEGEGRDTRTVLSSSPGNSSTRLKWRTWGRRLHKKQVPAILLLPLLASLLAASVSGCKANYGDHSPFHSLPLSTLRLFSNTSGVDLVVEDTVSSVKKITCLVPKLSVAQCYANAEAVGSNRVQAHV